MNLSELEASDYDKFVGLLTPIQKDQLVGRQYAPNSYFNPVLDGNEPANWIISTQEVNDCTNPEFHWVKDLPLIDWVEPVYTDGNETD
jgi:hypothetical protein